MICKALVVSAGLSVWAWFRLKLAITAGVREQRQWLVEGSAFI